MRFLWITLLLWNLPLSFVFSLNCKLDEEYAWPYEAPERCCAKCKPGEFMTRRCQDGLGTVCEECSDGMFTETHNILSRCKGCSICGQNERQISACTTNRNAVCECEPGYKRYGNLECEKERREVKTTATTTTTQPQRSTTTKQLPKPTPNESYESVLLPVVLTVCMCILLLIVATKLKKMELCGCCLIEDSTSSKDTQSTEEEALPIQEVCSHIQDEEWRQSKDIILFINK